MGILFSILLFYLKYLKNKAMTHPSSTLSTVVLLTITISPPALRTGGCTLVLAAFEYFIQWFGEFNAARPALDFAIQLVSVLYHNLKCHGVKLSVILT